MKAHKSGMSTYISFKQIKKSTQQHGPTLVPKYLCIKNPFIKRTNVHFGLKKDEKDIYLHNTL